MRGESAAGAMGFVDMLIGAMAAIVLLFMAQAARPPAKPGFGVGGPTVRVELDGAATGQPAPGLAVRYHLAGHAVALAATDLGRVGELRVLPLGEPDGASVHTIQLAEKARFDEHEELLVYIHDLNGRPQEKPISIQTTLRAGGEVRLLPTKPATANNPVWIIPMNQLSGQRGRIQRFEVRQPQP